MTPQFSNPTEPLPRANVRPASKSFSEEEFVNIENVPVFTEHETTARDGRLLQFGPAELQAVCDRCNRRIDEGGDFAAVTIGHTPNPDEAKDDPEVVGFAGPFRMGTLGEPGQRQRQAILADFHIFKGDYAKSKKHPRRSPEVWLEDSYDQMFLDPIALLGAVAPRLDMGILYAARNHGRLVEKYTAVAPAATSVFVPDGIKPKHRLYAADNTQGTTNMLGHDDLKQLIHALRQTDVFQFVESLMAQEAGPEASVPGADAPPPPMPDPMTPASPPDPAAGPEGVPSPAPDDGPSAGLEEMPKPPGPDSTPPAAPDRDKEAMGQRRYGAENATGEYQTADQATDFAGSKEALDGFAAAKEKKYAACDELDDDEFEDYGKQRTSRRKSRKKNYAADGSVDADGDDGTPAANATVEGGDDGPSAGSADDDDADGENATGEYQKAKPPAKYARDTAEHGRELHALTQHVEQLTTELDAERGRRVDTERYSMLSEASMAVVLDPSDEIEVCRYERMSDDQFTAHLDRVMQNYRPQPVGHVLPTHSPGASLAAAGSPDRPGGAANRERYSRELCDKATAICTAAAERGEQVDFAETLEQLRTGPIG